MSAANMARLDAYEETLSAVDRIAQIKAAQDQRKAQEAADREELKSLTRSAALPLIDAAAAELEAALALMRSAAQAGDAQGVLAVYDGSSNGLFYGPINRIKAERKHLG